MTEVVVDGGQRDRLALQSGFLVFPYCQRAALLSNNLLHDGTYIKPLPRQYRGGIQTNAHGAFLLRCEPDLRLKLQNDFLEPDVPRSASAYSALEEPDCPAHSGT